MSASWWLLLPALSLLSYAQRALPWVAVRRLQLPGPVAAWLRQLAPAAFATLMVQDMGRLSPLTAVALLAAGAIGLRTRSLGLTVLTAVAIGTLSALPGLHGN